MQDVTVEEKATKVPSSFLTADEIVERLRKAQCPITSARLMELANAGYIPCWRWHVDGKESAPLFRSEEVMPWIRSNLLARHVGIPFPHELAVLCPTVEPHLHLAGEDVPTALLPMKSVLYTVSTELYCGVYFLVRQDTVVYVGQSINALARVGSHGAEGRKKFDRAYLLPVPESELNDVESAFIRALSPEYNGNEGNGARDSDEAILLHYAPDIARRAFGQDVRSARPWPPPKHQRSETALPQPGGHLIEVTCWSCGRVARVHTLLWNRRAARCLACATVLVEQATDGLVYLTAPASTAKRQRADAPPSGRVQESTP